MLFAEVAAPAGLAGAVGLETLRELVGGSLAAVITEVEALGGTVTSVSGRGLQAMFGAPQAHEDDPERAVLAGLPRADGGRHRRGRGRGRDRAADRRGIGPGRRRPDRGRRQGRVRRVRRRGQRGRRPAVGRAGRERCWSARRPGPSPATCSPGARARRYRSAAMPGRWSPATWRRRRARVGERRPRGVGGRAALIGRDAEMRVLETALRQAVEGQGSVVVLTGEAGLGKTRLVQECRKRFIAWVGAGSGRRPLWLEGRCASYASATPYGLYRQLIASWIGVALDEPAGPDPRGPRAAALTRLLGNTNLLMPLAWMMGLPSRPGPAGPAPRTCSG